MRELIILVAIVTAMMHSLVIAASYGKQVDVQAEVGGESVTYVHGTWCMDGRVF